MGGAILTLRKCLVEFTDNSTVLFYNNSALFGGGIFMSFNCHVAFAGDLNSNISFLKNNGGHGGALCSYCNCTFTFKTRSLV